MLGSIFASRASFAQATRSARANALNTASTWWWLESPVEDLRVHVGLGAHGEAVEEVGHQLALQVADQPHLHLQIHLGVRAAAEIHGHHRQRLVHRHHEVAGAVDALAVAERRQHRFPEHDADVLDGVVLIDVQVALGLQRQVEAAVPREQLQHVVEEADAGADVVAALAVDRQRAADVGLLGAPVEFRRACAITSALGRLRSWSLVRWSLGPWSGRQSAAAPQSRRRGPPGPRPAPASSRSGRLPRGPSSSPAAP